MEENKNSESSFSEGLSISDDELEKSYTHSRVNEGFKHLKAQIEGLTDIITPKMFTENDLADPSTVDASVVEFVRRPKNAPRTSPDHSENQPEPKEAHSEVNELLMQWVRKLIEEKKEADKKVEGLMKSRVSEVNKEQNTKRNHDKLKERNKLLEKKVTELQQSLQESEIQKKSLENTLRLTIESGFNKMNSSSEIGKKVEDVEVIARLKEELRQKDEEIERMKMKTEEQAQGLESIIAKHRAEMEVLKRTNTKVSLALQKFKEVLESRMLRLHNEVGKKAEEFDGQIRSISELAVKPHVLKLWIAKNGKEGLIKYLAKLKDSIEDIKRIHKKMKTIKQFAWRLKPFYRIF